MSLGCDYSFKSGARNPKGRYAAIVKNGKGQVAVVGVKLEDHGMAAMFVDGWRPADQPFKGVFVEQVGGSSSSSKPEWRPISAEIEFQLNPNQE